MSGHRSRGNVEVTRINTSRDDALMLFILIVQYQHMLPDMELETALFRLKYEFHKFEQWLQGMKGVSFTDK